VVVVVERVVAQGRTVVLVVAQVVTRSALEQEHLDKVSQAATATLTGLQV